MPLELEIARDFAYKGWWLACWGLEAAEVKTEYGAWQRWKMAPDGLGAWTTYLVPKK